MTPLRNGALLVVGLATAALVASHYRSLEVTVSPVVRGTAVDAVYATGTVEALNRVFVKAKTSGTVTAIFSKEGTQVRNGELLAGIANPALSYELGRGRIELSAANAQAGVNAPQLLALRGQQRGLRAELARAQLESQRSGALSRSGSVPAAELDRAQSQVEQVQGALAANEAQQRALRIDLTSNAARQKASVQTLEARLADTEVRAPLTGVVLSRAVEVGEVVAVNQPLFKVGDVSKLILEVSVDEADIGKLRDGKGSAPASEVAVALFAFPNQVFHGRIFEIMPEAERDRKAFLAKVSLDDAPEGLRSGMSTEVNIIANERRDVLLISTEALDGQAVWVVTAGHAMRRSVKLGIRDLLRVEVLAGLNEGDQVVVGGQEYLSSGARVRATELAPDSNDTQPQPGKLSQRSIR